MGAGCQRMALYLVKYGHMKQRKQLAVLMSIKPQYANRIFSGEKKFEFRKRPPRSDIKKVIVYASSPIQHIIGEFTISRIVCDSPSKIWGQCKDCAGIDKESFMEYFRGRNEAFAICIDTTTLYSRQVNIGRFCLAPPQSYCYVDL